MNRNALLYSVFVLLVDYNRLLTLSIMSNKRFYISKAYDIHMLFFLEKELLKAAETGIIVLLQEKNLGAKYKEHFSNAFTCKNF